MREIINIQTGQCGNQIGSQFWDTLLKEHKISNEGFRQENMEDNLDVYFSEAQNKKYVPRCVLIDLEPGTQENIKSSNLGKLFKPDNFIFGSGGAGNNWAKGHYTEGAEIIDSCMEAIRRESEICEMMQGFQICHSLGGGTGSGMGTLLLTKLREDFPDRMISTFSIVPSPKVSDTIVEPYNATLSIHQLVENTDGTILIDNAALYNLCSKKLKIKEPSYSHMNNLVATVMSGITTSLRFPSHLNADMRKLFVNMVPFPRLHFFLPGQAPLFENESSQYMNLNTNDLINQLLNGPLMAEGDMTNGRYLAVSAIFRGEFNIHAIDEIIYKKRVDNFVSWIPNSIKIATCPVKPLNGDISATFLANTTAVQEIYNRILAQFSSMFKRKAFLHWYISEGMDEMEFTEAESNLKDLLNEYVQYQNEE